MDRPVSRLSSRSKHYGDAAAGTPFASCFQDASAHDGIGLRPESRQGRSRRASQHNSVSFATTRIGSEGGDAVGKAAQAAPLSPLPSWPSRSTTSDDSILASPAPLHSRRTVLPALPHQVASLPHETTSKPQCRGRVSRTVSSPGFSLGLNPAFTCSVLPLRESAHDRIGFRPESRQGRSRRASQHNCVSFAKTRSDSEGGRDAAVGAKTAQVLAGPESSESSIPSGAPMHARRSSIGYGLPGKLSSPEVGRPLLPTCRSSGLSRRTSVGSQWAPTTDPSFDSGSSLSCQSSVDPSFEDNVSEGYGLPLPQVRGGRLVSLAETPSGAADPAGLKRAQRALGDGLRPYDLDLSLSSSAHCVKRKSASGALSPPGAGVDTLMSAIFG